MLLRLRGCWFLWICKNVDNVCENDRFDITASGVSVFDSTVKLAAALIRRKTCEEAMTLKILTV